MQKKYPITCFVVVVDNKTNESRDFELFGLRNIKEINANGSIEKDGLLIKSGYSDTTYEDLLYYTIGRKFTFDTTYMITDNHSMFDERFVYKHKIPFGVNLEIVLRSYIAPNQEQKCISRIIPFSHNPDDEFCLEVDEMTTIKGKVLPNTILTFQFYVLSIEKNTTNK